MENAAIFKPTNFCCLKLKNTEKFFIRIILEFVTQLTSYLLESTNTGIWFTEANSVPVVDEQTKLIFFHTLKSHEVRRHFKIYKHKEV